MFTRTMRPEEAAHLDLIRAVAFESPYEPPKADAEPHPDPMTWWVSGEADQLYGCIGVLPAQARFDGHIVPIGGIGGVATLPQYRRKGAIRACMNAALRDLHRTGAVFSALYPFSRAYYRKFGYEDGPSVSTWTLPFDALRLPETGGSMDLILPGSDPAPVLEAYHASASRWNLSFTPTHFFKHLTRENWMKDCRYLYLWRDETNAPAGAILFAKRDGIMDCTTSFALPNCLLFRDVRALSALLRFARSFAADYSAIRFDVPQGVRIDSLIGEGNAAHCAVKYNGMARLVNVRRALELCRTRGEGSAVIAVSDSIIPENAAAWQVEFNPAGDNLVRPADTPPDVELSAGVLAQLLLGYRTADDLPMMPEVRVHNPAAPLNRIFFSKPCHLLDLF
ncbi:MAG: enhanced intracellular survival protein Eis [Candidatus Faecivicinus sp.]